MTTINRKQLAAALKIVSPALSKGAVNPTLHGVHVDLRGTGATLTCTDLDLTISTTVDADDVDTEPLTLLLPATTLTRVVGSMRGADVHLTQHEFGDRVTLTSGDTTVDLIPINVDGWPDSLTATPGTEWHDLSATDVDNIARVIHARSTNEALPPFFGIHLAPGVAQATDSYRLAQVDIGDSGFPDIIIPGAVLASVLSACDGSLEVTTDGRSVRLTDQTTTWTTRLVHHDGGYPKFDRFTSMKLDDSVTVQAAELVESLQRMGALGPIDQQSATRLSGGPDGLVLRRTMADVGEMQDCIPCDGTLPEVKVSPTSLIDAVEGAGSDEVTIEGGGAKAPLIVRSTSGYLAVVMPVAPSKAAA